jgi:hypothetical protein
MRDVLLSSETQSLRALIARKEYGARRTCFSQIQQARETLEKLSLLQSAPVERDRFVSHLSQSRREYRRACETAGKSGKQIERC